MAEPNHCPASCYTPPTHNCTIGITQMTWRIALVMLFPLLLLFSYVRYSTKKEKTETPKAQIKSSRTNHCQKMDQNERAWRLSRDKFFVDIGIMEAPKLENMTLRKTYYVEEEQDTALGKSPAQSALDQPKGEKDSGVQKLRMPKSESKLGRNGKVVSELCVPKTRAPR